MSTVENLNANEVYIWFSNKDGEGMETYLVDCGGSSVSQNYFDPVPTAIAIREALNQFMGGNAGGAGRITRIEVRSVSRQLVRAGRLTP